MLRALRESRDFASARVPHETPAAAGSTVGLTTAYRTLRMLERTGHVDLVRERTGERLYRPRPTDGHRHYLVCRHCVAESTGFTEVERTVELTGVCNRCRPQTVKTW